MPRDARITIKVLAFMPIPFPAGVQPDNCNAGAVVRVVKSRAEVDAPRATASSQSRRADATAGRKTRLEELPLDLQGKDAWQDSCKAVRH